MFLRLPARRLGAFCLALVLTCAVFIPAASSPTAAADAADLVQAIVASMTPRERVAQLVLVNFVGSDVSPSAEITRLIRDYRVGAVLITASNGNVINRGDTAAQVARLTNELQQRALEGTKRSVEGQELFIPLFIATDNEGDSFPYSNLTNNFTSLPSSMTIGAAWSKDDAEIVGRIVGRELSATGINMLLGPVVDVLDNPRSGGSGDIGTRSFGGNPAWVGALGSAYVRGVHAGSAGRMVTVAKHFPGHGGSDRSPDSEVATVNKSLDELRGSELLPFSMVTSGPPDGSRGVTDSLMTSHIRYRGFQAVDPFTRPLSFDSRGLQAAMALPEFAAWRKEGVIVSDALGVLAVKKWYDPTLSAFPNRQVARDALLAGNDILSLVEFSTEPGWAEHQVPSIVDTIEFLAQQYGAEAELRARVDEAVRRVLTLKARVYPNLQLADTQVDPAVASSLVGQGHDQMEALTRRALTLISPSSDQLRSRMPRGPRRGERILIVECWEDCFPYRIIPQLNIRDAIVRLYGPAGVGEVRPEDIETISFGELQRWVAGGPDVQRVADAVTTADYVVLALAEYNPTSFPASGAARQFLDSAPLDLRNKKVVAIAFNAPYYLDATQIGKLTAYFAVYSKTTEAIDTAVRALFREVEPRGASPVTVSAVGYDLTTAAQPDPSQSFTIQLATDSSGPTVATTSKIQDRQQRPVPDGTDVAFDITRGAEVAFTRSAKTVDGVASVVLSPMTGTYTVQARAGGARSRHVTGANASPGLSGGLLDTEGVASTFPWWSVAVAASLFAGAAVGWMLSRRGWRPAQALAVVGITPSSDRRSVTTVTPVATQPSLPPSLALDQMTRQVWVAGKEVSPPLSAEQYRLLSYLYERAGQVCSRDEVVASVWPDAHSAGISEEALDALVRRVRDRLNQAGAARRHLVTLRGYGFRLDL